MCVVCVCACCGVCVRVCEKELRKRGAGFLEMITE